MLDELMENEAFINGVAVGISLHQQRVLAAHRHKEPLIIGNNMYYIQDGRERLQDVIDRICR